MARDKGYFEKDYDDHVNEDDYYEDNYEEELVDEEYEDDEIDDDDDEEDEDEGRRIQYIYACEDCDYRWDDYKLSSGGFVGAESPDDIACPMCGSDNVEQI